jgi:hypothetical protein
MIVLARRSNHKVVSKVRHIHETFLRHELGDLPQHHLKQIQPLQSSEFSFLFAQTRVQQRRLRTKIWICGKPPSLNASELDPCSIHVLYTAEGDKRILSHCLHSIVFRNCPGIHSFTNQRADSQYIRRESARSERINLRHVLPASLIIYILFRSRRFCFHSETLISGLQVIHNSQMVMVRAFPRL